MIKEVDRFILIYDLVIVRNKSRLLVAWGQEFEEGVIGFWSERIATRGV